MILNVFLELWSFSMENREIGITYTVIVAYTALEGVVACKERSYEA